MTAQPEPYEPDDDEHASATADSEETVLRAALSDYDRRHAHGRVGDGGTHTGDPSPRGRHRDDVTTYMASPMRAVTIRSVRVEAIASEVAERPRGGRRAAPGPAQTGPPRGGIARLGGPSVTRHPYASRARRTADGMLVDAFDAAAFIAIRCTFWDVAQILAHKSLARLAYGEAIENLDRKRRREAPNVLHPFRRHAFFVALSAERAELDHCAVLLYEVQDTGVLDGY